MSEPENDSAIQESAEPPVEQTASSSIMVEVVGHSDVGQVREHNEDNFLVADITNGKRGVIDEVKKHVVGPKGSLFLVCDGMGGAAAGEVASQIAVDTIFEMMQTEEVTTQDEDWARLLEMAITEAGIRIFTAAKINRKQRGMGTTGTAAVLAGPRLILGQVGDSRAHIVRQGALVQVTKDQSLVQQLIDAKQLTEEEARNFDKSNIILQALGTTEDVHVDVTSVMLCRGDVLIMCSDGLSGLVPQDTIRQTVTQTETLDEICSSLIAAANAAGGHDNVTVIAARFSGDAIFEPGETNKLAYEKFLFTSSVPKRYRQQPPPSPQKEPDPPSTLAAAPKDEPATKEIETPSIPPPPRRSHMGIGVFLVLIVLVIGGIAALALTSAKWSDTRIPAQGSEGTDTPRDTPKKDLPPVPAPVVQPVNAPNDAAAHAQPQESSAGPARIPSSDNEALGNTEKGQAAEPPLAPTPESAFTGPPKSLDNAGQKPLTERPKKPRKPASAPAEEKREKAPADDVERNAVKVEVPEEPPKAATLPENPF